MPRDPEFDPRKLFENFHESYAQVIDGVWDLFFPGDGAGASTTLDDLKETTRQFQGLIGRARAAGRPLRAAGSRWSLSKAPTTTGWSINTNRLRGRMKVSPLDLDPAYPGTADQKSGLYLFQCGNTVADVNKAIEAKSQGRALFTSGAANGQTIAGATSCGTHGSALEHGALHDHIVAIHLVPTAGTHLWIERKSRPVMKREWVEGSLGAALKRDDDDLFNAAVVSFGSFGLIESVVIETVPRYRLKTNPVTVTLDEPLWRAIGALDFSAHPVFAGKTPYFFQAVINPSSTEALLSINEKLDCPPDFAPQYGLTQKDHALGPGFDSLSLVGAILDRFPGLIPTFGKAAAAQLFDTRAQTGTPGMIYNYKAPQLHVASGSLAVALPDARRTLEALVALYRQMGNVPLVFGCRYVRRTPALLGFNRWDMTLAISIDGVDSNRSRAFFAAAADRIEQLGIPFTQHWGKVNHYTKARVEAVYGANVGKWRDARRRVLPDPADRALFDNLYIAERGLAA